MEYVIRKAKEKWEWWLKKKEQLEKSGQWTEEQEGLLEEAYIDYRYLLIENRYQGRYVYKSNEV